MKSKFLFLLLISISILHNGFPLQAQSRLRPEIAIFDFAGENVTVFTANLLAERFRGELLNTGAFIVLDRSIMAQKLAAVNLKLADCIDAGSAIEAGKKLRVRKVIIGTVFEVNSVFSIHIKLIDVRSAQTERFFSRDFSGDINGLLNQLKDLAAEVAGSCNSVYWEHTGSRRKTNIAISCEPPVRYHISVGFFRCDTKKDEFITVEAGFFYHYGNWSGSFSFGKVARGSYDFEGASAANSEKRLAYRDMLVAGFSLDYIFSPEKPVAPFAGLGILFTTPVKEFLTHSSARRTSERVINSGVCPQAGVYLLRFFPIAGRIAFGYLLNPEIESINYSGLSFEGALLLNF